MRVHARSSSPFEFSCLGSDVDRAAGLTQAELVTHTIDGEEDRNEFSVPLRYDERIVGLELGLQIYAGFSLS